MVLVKKAEFIILSAINFLFGSVVYLWLDPLPIVYLVLAIIAINSFIWYRFFKIYKNNLVIPKLIFITLYLTGSLILLYLFPNLNLIVKAFYLLFLSGSLYILMLATNIFVASEKVEEFFPLIQPAKVVVFILLLLSVFNWSNVAYKLPFLFKFEGLFAFSMQIFLLIIVFTLLFMFSGWFILGGWVGDATENLVFTLRRGQLSIIIILVQTSVVLSFFPYEDFGRGMVLSAVTYSLVSLVGSYLSHKSDKSIYWGSGIIIATSLILAYLL